MSKLTPDEQADINAIKERLDKTTPGPWQLLPVDGIGPDGATIYNVEDYGPICHVGDPYPRGNNHPQENMDWIVAAHDQDIPRLLAIIACLEYDRNEEGEEVYDW